MIRYCVTDRRRGNVLALAARAIGKGVEMIQVREKDLPASELLEVVRQIRNLASGTSTRVVVNDRLDVALAANADGIQLPANGLPAKRVRPFVKVLGVSTHTVEEAIAASGAGADFIVFGPIFNTPGKNAVGLEPLRQVVSAVKTPVLAIGGMTSETIPLVMEAGAAGFAAIRLFQTD